MSQFIPVPADQPSTFPVPTDQSSKDQPPLVHTNNAHTSAEEFSLEMRATNNNQRPDEFIYRSTDLADRILAQVQHDFASVEKHIAFEMQAMTNIAAMIPRVPLPPTSLFKDIGHVAAMEVVSQHIIPTLYGEQQWQSLLQPIHTFMDDLRATTVYQSVLSHHWWKVFPVTSSKRIHFYLRRSQGGVN